MLKETLMERSKGEVRRSKLLELIQDQGKISIQDIVEQLKCSEATARRDLDILERSGRIIRTIGGAVIENGTLLGEQSFHNKHSFLREEKERIAASAAGLVEEGDVVCLTGGTTTFFIAKALKKHRNITV